MDEIIAFRIAQLDDQQRHILLLLASGATHAEVAARLGLSCHATRRLTRAILATLGIRTIREATLLWWGSRAGARADLLAAARALVA